MISNLTQYYFDNEEWDYPVLRDDDGVLIDHLEITDRTYSWIVINGIVYMSYETSHYGAIEVALMSIHHLDNVEQIEKKFGCGIDDICEEIRYSKTNQCEGRFFTKYNLIQVTDGDVNKNIISQICNQIGITPNNTYFVGSSEKARMTGLPSDYYSIIPYNEFIQEWNIRENKIVKKLNESQIREIIKDVIKEIYLG